MGRHLDLIEDLVHLGQVQRAGRGQLQASTNPSEQQVLEHVLELRHLLAHRALGQEQLFGGAGKTQMARHGLEALQGGHGRHQAFGHGGLVASA